MCSCICGRACMSVCVQACVGLSEMLHAAACAPCLLPGDWERAALCVASMSRTRRKKNCISVCKTQWVVHVAAAEEVRAGSKAGMGPLQGLSNQCSSKAGVREGKKYRQSCIGLWQSANGGNNIWSSAQAANEPKRATWSRAKPTLAGAVYSVLAKLNLSQLLGYSATSRVSSNTNWSHCLQFKWWSCVG